MGGGERVEKGLQGVESSGAFLIFLVASGTVAFFGNGGFSRATIEQPIDFNHRLHVVDEELECASCHPGFETEASSGLPSNELCALCHSEPQGDSAEELRLVELLEAGTPLEWRRLFRQPPHVFFSHRRHVVVAGMECAECHGDIGQSEAPPDVREPLPMSTCIECHEQQGVANGCAACHR